MCIGMNGDTRGAGPYSVSTSNRNFEGRQGAGRPHVAGEPADRRCGAVRGRVTDPRELAARLSHATASPPFSSRTVVLPVENIDTDQIIPARFLRPRPQRTRQASCSRTGATTRTDRRNPDFVAEPAGSARLRAILVAGRNFGCGSSREHAPWALLDYGFRAVIRFAHTRSVWAIRYRWPRLAP